MTFYEQAADQIHLQFIKTLKLACEIFCKSYVHLLIYFILYYDNSSLAVRGKFSVSQVTVTLVEKDLASPLVFKDPPPFYPTNIRLRSDFCIFTLRGH